MVIDLGDNLALRGGDDSDWIIFEQSTGLIHFTISKEKFKSLCEKLHSLVEAERETEHIEYHKEMLECLQHEKNLIEIPIRLTIDVKVKEGKLQ